MTIYSGFSHEKWWFSIVTLNYIKLPEGNLHILQHRKICTKTIPNWDFQPSKGQIPRPQPPSQPQKKTAPQLFPSVPSVPSACSTLFIFTKAHLRFRTLPTHRTHIGSTRLLTSGCHQQKLLGFGVQRFVPLRPYQSTENVVGQQTFGVFRHPNGF